MFRIGARCRSVCPCFTWCAFPLQLSIHLRLFSHLVGRIKHSNILFLPFYCKRTTSFKSRNNSTSLTWGIQLMCQGTSNAWQLLKIWLCVCIAGSELWVFWELLCSPCWGCKQAIPKRWTELPLTLKSGGDVWPYTSLQTWASPADTILLEGKKYD